MHPIVLETLHANMLVKKACVYIYIYIYTYIYIPVMLHFYIMMIMHIIILNAKTPKISKAPQEGFGESCRQDAALLHLRE